MARDIRATVNLVGGVTGSEVFRARRIRQICTFHLHVQQRGMSLRDESAREAMSGHKTDIMKSERPISTCGRAMIVIASVKTRYRLCAPPFVRSFFLQSLLMKKKEDFATTAKVKNQYKRNEFP